jgi:hypothetical protein
VSLYADFDFDTAAWLEIPAHWGPETWPDHRAWARERAELCWLDLDPGESEVDNLALALAYLAEKLPSGDGDRVVNHFLHLPHPRLDPLHAQVWIVEDPDVTLEYCVGAEDPQTVEKPVLEEFVSERLGTGLRGLRYKPFDPGPGHEQAPGALVGAVRYAWRLNEEAVLVMSVVDTDLARLIQATEDIDEFARGIGVVNEDDEADLPV